MEFPLISIILLSYKNIEYIYNAIDSILLQNYPKIEVIVADDGTENFDIDIYRNYINNNKNNNIVSVKLYSNEFNIGTVRNLNKAIQISKGKYIKILATDDQLKDADSISMLAKYINSEQEKYDLVVSTIELCDENMINIEKIELGMVNWKNKTINLAQSNDVDNLYELLCKGNIIAAPGVLFDKKIFEKYGLFDESYTLLEDYPYWLKLARENAKFKFIEYESVKYRLGTGISTRKNINKVLCKDEKICFEKEIFKYKNRISLHAYRKAKFNYLKVYEKNSNKIFNKIMLLTKYTNLIFDDNKSVDNEMCTEHLKNIDNECVEFNQIVENLVKYK